MGLFSKKPSGTSNDAARQILQGGAAAEELLNIYGGVLEVTSKMTWGAPISLLPEAKDRIKAAIMVNLSCLQALGMLDKKIFNLMKVGYIQLASFIEDSEAKASVAALAAFNTGDLARVSSPEVRAGIERLRRIHEERNCLSMEFDERAKSLGIRAPTE